jgi:DNA-binding response OmpR family regulator
MPDEHNRENRDNSAWDVVIVGEDCPELVQLVGSLAGRGLRADIVGDPDAVARAVVGGRPDAVVVDLRDDDKVANRIVNWLYRNGGGNALAITEIGDVDTRVRVLNLGLIDHLVAPFETREAVARILHLVARRRSNRRPRLQAGDLTVDVAQRTVERGGERVNLTPREVDVLCALLENVDKPLSKQELLKIVWAGESRSENLVEANVSSLRRKLHDLGPPIIHTVHRAGYVLRPVATGPAEARAALVAERNRLVQEREAMIVRREEIMGRHRDH